MTFVRTNPQNVIGVTNWHVAEELKNQPDAILKTCRIANIPFEVNRYIAKHEENDLASFQLSDILLAPFNGVAINISEKQLVEGDVVFLGGFPAQYITDNPVTPVFDFAWFAGKVANVSERNISLVLDIENSISFSNERILPHADLGGWSGGAVFHVVDENLIERLELVGIIYEYSEGSEIVFAHPLTSLTEEGLFI